MPNPKLPTSIVAALCAPLLVACLGKGAGDDSSAGTGCSDAPVAMAGVDGTGVPGVKYTLDGSASTVSGGGQPICTWTVESVPEGSRIDIGDLSIIDPCKPSFTPDVAGTYVFGLIVTDSCGQVSAAVLVEMTVVSTSFVPDCVADYVVGLTVGDGGAWSAPVYCTVTAAPA